MRVGVFGGSFDPPHVGHVLAAVYVHSIGEVDRVLVVPTFEHAFGKALSPFSERLRLCDRAFERLPNVSVSAVEATLGKPSYTLRTLEHLRAEHPDWELRLIAGTDVLAETDKWHAFDAVTELAPLLVLGRHGHERDGTRALLPDISSTDVRELLARSKRPTEDPELSHLVPRRVLEYIVEHGLYRAVPAGLPPRLEEVS